MVLLNSTVPNSAQVLFSLYLKLQYADINVATTKQNKKTKKVDMR